jgi:hypothetical protein
MSLKKEPILKKNGLFCFYSHEIHESRILSHACVP